MQIERMEFPGHSGEMLAARLDRPLQEPRAYALFAHCFTCTKDIIAARRIAEALTAHGVAVVRFDFTGLGHSDGEFANTTFTSNVEDLVAAADYMRAHLGPAQLLIGHSLGGAAIIAAAERIPDARAVATIGAPHDPGHVLHNFGTSLERIAAEGSASVMLAGRSFTIGAGFVEDVSAASLDVALAGLKKALLVMHAPQDATVGIDNASAIYLAARHPKSFVSLDGADHLLSRAVDAEYAAHLIAAWSRRYIRMEEAEPVGIETAEGAVMVSEADPGGFLQQVSAGAHHTLADEPVSVGGDDLGFTPYQLVAAGLGACTSMTIRMYARRKGWPLDHVSVEVDHDRVHAEDCATCEAANDKIDVFRRRIHLSGDLTAEQQARCMEIADKCPVHRTLESEIRVETTQVS